MMNIPSPHHAGKVIGVNSVFFPADGGPALVTAVSAFTGETHTMHLPITEEEFDRWRNGELIQKVWPNLTNEQREFLKTGTTPEEWGVVFGDR